MLQLQLILGQLQAKTKVLQDELEAEEDNASGAHFETEDPNLRQYIVGDCVLSPVDVGLMSLVPTESGTVPRWLESRHGAPVHVHAR